MLSIEQTNTPGPLKLKNRRIEFKKGETVESNKIEKRQKNEKKKRKK